MVKSSTFIQFRGLIRGLSVNFLQFRGLIRGLSVHFVYISWSYSQLFVVFGLVTFLDLDSHGAATFTLPWAPSLTEMLLRSSSRVLTWRL